MTIEEMSPAAKAFVDMVALVEKEFSRALDAHQRSAGVAIFRTGEKFPERIMRFPPERTFSIDTQCPPETITPEDFTFRFAEPVGKALAHKGLDEGFKVFSGVTGSPNFDFFGGDDFYSFRVHAWKEAA